MATETLWLVILTATVGTVLAAVAALTYIVRRALTRQDAPVSDEPADPKRIRWRKNVLMLFGVAYASMFGLFLGMAFFGVSADKAYELVSVPFVALVGGTLAIVKDLLD